MLLLVKLFVIKLSAYILKIVKKKMKAWEQKFKKERKESIRYFKNIEAENNDLKGKLWDLRNRSRQGNLRFDGIVEYGDD